MSNNISSKVLSPLFTTSPFTWKQDSLKKELSTKEKVLVIALTILAAPTLIFGVFTFFGISKLLRDRQIKKYNQEQTPVSQETIKPNSPKKPKEDLIQIEEPISTAQNEPMIVDGKILSLEELKQQASSMEKEELSKAIQERLFEMVDHADFSGLNIIKEILNTHKSFSTSSFARDNLMIHVCDQLSASEIKLFLEKTKDCLIENENNKMYFYHMLAFRLQQNEECLKETLSHICNNIPDTMNQHQKLYLDMIIDIIKRKAPDFLENDFVKSYLNTKPIKN